MIVLRILIILGAAAQLAMAAVLLFVAEQSETPSSRLNIVLLGLAGLLGIVVQFRPKYRVMAVPCNWICAVFFAMVIFGLLKQDAADATLVDDFALTLSAIIVAISVMNAIGIPKLPQLVGLPPVGGVVEPEKGQTE